MMHVSQSCKPLIGYVSSTVVWHTSHVRLSRIGIKRTLHVFRHAQICTGAARSASDAEQPLCGLQGRLDEHKCLAVDGKLPAKHQQTVNHRAVKICRTLERHDHSACVLFSGLVFPDDQRYRAIDTNANV